MKKLFYIIFFFLCLIITNHIISKGGFLNDYFVNKNVFKKDEPFYSRKLESSGWLKFRYGHSVIVIPITISGHRVDAILDSGATRTIVSTSLSNSLGILHRGYTKGIGFGGVLKGSEVVTNVAIGIGRMRFLSTPVVASMPINDFGPLHEGRVRLILGVSIFKHTAVEIDYKSQKIRFFNSKSIAPPPGMIKLPIKLIDGAIVFPLAIEDQPTRYFVLDTGDNENISVRYKYWKNKINILSKSINSSVSIVNNGKISIKYYLQRGDIGLSSGKNGDAFKFHNWPIRFYIKNESTLVHDSVSGYIGNHFLDSFLLVVDYPQRRAFLEPNSTSFQIFVHDVIGIVPDEINGHVRALVVYPGSPAATAGLRAGQIITAINGAPISSAHQLWDLETHATLGTKFKITLDDSTTRDLVASAPADWIH